MKIKNGLVISPEFTSAIQKLLKKEIPISLCLEISTMIEEIETQIKIVNRTRQAVLEKYTKKDVEGKFVTDEKGNAEFDNDDVKNKCLTELATILNEDFDVSLSTKIPLSKEDKMTPQEFILLKDLIEIQ
jgi:hypothetical protein